jgi:hypothetical protein
MHIVRWVVVVVVLTPVGFDRAAGFSFFPWRDEWEKKRKIII